MHEDVTKKSFVSVLKTGKESSNLVEESPPTIVLDDQCIMERDTSCSLMGKIKDIYAIPNLYIILANEGFKKVNITYLCGLWVLLDLDSITSKEKHCKHIGSGSWFNTLLPASDSFVSEERIVWISIEGLPLKALTRNTFAKIASSWGELMDLDISENKSFPYKKLCVKIKQNLIINDKLNFVVKVQVYWIRVKELETWSPNFIKESEDYLSSDNDSGGEDEEQKRGA
ncbi:hypothetical protein Tco_0414241 [Tanacetum coccineum]